MAQVIKISPDLARGFILRRHHLIEPAADPMDVVKALFGIQTQYAMSLPVALAARSRITKTWEERQANKAKTLVKTWSLRHTLHVHAAEDFGLIISAMGIPKYARYESWLRDSTKLSQPEVNALLEKVRCAIRAKPLSRSELHELVPELKTMPATGWGLDVMGLAYQGEIVLAPFGPGATRFAHAPTWFARELGEPIDPDSAATALFRRYVHGYGPVTLADFTYWLGDKATPARRALDHLMPELVEVHLEGHEGKRYLLESDLDELLEEAPSHRLSLLAKFDPLIMGYRDKSLFLDEKHRKSVSRAAGQVEATVLRKGRVTATWRLERKGSKALIKIEQLKRLTRQDLGRIERASTRLAKPLGFSSIELDKTS
jgi:hypothetical protein